MGYERVHSMLAARFYWYNMSQDLLEWCKACKSCQHAKRGAGKGKVPLKQDFVGAPMQRCGMDLQGPFPESRSGNKYVLVVQDYYSKWVELYGIADKQATTVAGYLVRDFFTRFGACERLHSDQGMEFDNKLTKELCDMWGIKKTRTTPFAPWSNGMVERSNKSIKQLLRQMCTEDYRSDWDEKLPFIRMTLNNTVHRTTGQTPFMLFMSRCEEAKLPCDLLLNSPWPQMPSCESEYVFRQRLTCQEIAEKTRRHLGKQAAIQRAGHARGGLKIRSYRIGDYVWRFFPPNAQDKLKPNPWTGPYRVLGVDDTGHSVLLDVPGVGRGGNLVNKWIHTSSVKPCVFTRQGHMMFTSDPSESGGDYGSGLAYSC